MKRTLSSHSPLGLVTESVAQSHLSCEVAFANIDYRVFQQNHDSLVNKNSGEGSGREGDNLRDSALHSLPGLENSGSATPSQSVLENANLE
jgi:hypothetical protein